MKLWCVLAHISWVTEGGWETSTGIPTFFLDPSIQAIQNNEHACEIARKIIDPLGNLIVNVGVRLDMNGLAMDETVVFKTFKPEEKDETR